MNILLTNDDGFNSIGITKLKEKLVKYGRVVILAPLHHMSAKSTSITIGKGMELKEIEKDVYAFDGTPADCVSFALSSLDIDFDLVVSGCNNGLNISFDTMYSGTIGACLEALSFRKKTIAVSCETNQFDKIEYFDDVFKFITSNDLISNNYILNINFPINEVKGMEIGKLYYRNKDLFFRKKDDGYYAYRNIDDECDEYPGTDCYQVRHNIISIVPLNNSYFNENIYDKIVNKISK